MCYWKCKKICLPVVTQIVNHTYFEVTCKRRINRARERERESEKERVNLDTFYGILDFQIVLLQVYYIYYMIFYSFITFNILFIIIIYIYYYDIYFMSYYMTPYNLIIYY